MQLYRQGQIDAAWVAFCPDAAAYAKQHLISSRELDVSKRFGRQVTKGSYGKTSLLIMKIGRKIIVDGCHSYKTHVFDVGDPAAPCLFSQTYDCDRIRDSSKRSKPHNSIEVWKSWVMVQALSGAIPSHQRAVNMSQPAEISTPQRDETATTSLSVNTKASKTIKAYSQLLMQSLGTEAGVQRVQLFERLMNSGKGLTPMAGKKLSSPASLNTSESLLVTMLLLTTSSLAPIRNSLPDTPCSCCDGSRTVTPSPE
jgi:hypothetical protein